MTHTAIMPMNSGRSDCATGEDLVINFYKYLIHCNLQKCSAKYGGIIFMCQGSFLMERLPWGISSESVTFLTAEEEHYIGLGHKQNDSFLPDELREQLHRMKCIPSSRLFLPGLGCD